MKLQIARNFTLPAEAVTQTFAILGIRGSGKTNTGVVMTEELLAAKQQVVIIDPVDVWWGLKSSKSGKEPGFSIPVIGGDHADIPLDGAAGQVLADFVTESRASVILSLRHLSMNDQRKFAGEFAKRLYERKGQQRSPLMVILDEADEFVPQHIPKGHEPMFGAFDRLVRRGRSSGIGVTLISQRAQVVNKDVLSQCETLIGMRVLHKLDRKALEAWIEAHDTEGRQQEFLGSLASLGRGDAWIWSPSWLNAFERVHIRERQTFDSSATPAAGAAVQPPKEVAHLDLEKLRASMAAQIEKAKADDPRALRAEIQRLQGELKKTTAAAGKPAEPTPDQVDAWRGQGYKDGYREGVSAENLRLASLISGGIETIRLVCSDLANEAHNTARTPAPKLPPPAPPRPARQEIRRDLPAPRPTRQLSDSSGHLPTGERAVLTVCAQYPEGATREQLSILTGYKRSSRDAYVQRLREKGFVVSAGDLVVATGDGFTALGPDFEALPTGEALRDYWRAKLPEGERAILEVLIDAYPRAVPREVLDEETGYKRSSRDAYVQRLKSRKLVVITGPGEVCASEVLFE